MNKGDIDKNLEGGSNITDPEEKAARKLDDWRAHKHEKHRNADEPFREGELHGVVGKEIEELIEQEKPRAFKNQNIDYGMDIMKEGKDKCKKFEDFNNKSTDPNPDECVKSNQTAEMLIETLEHQKAHIKYPHDTPEKSL